MTQPQEHQFQTEVRQLLQLMIHSLYSNREIFLRELISNAADANDKLRYAALADDTLLGDDNVLKIQIEINSKARTIAISDNGIGMCEEEAIQNLGTIAKSGSAEFLRNLSGDQRKDAQIIGQFGVGFYAAFMVADKVEVFSRKAGETAAQGVHWTSLGDGAFTVESCEKSTRGTRVLVHLKKDAAEFAEKYRAKNLVRKYSDHIAFPVFLNDANAEKKTSSDSEAEEQPQAINSATALWLRSKQDVSDEEYAEFYQHISHDNETPLSWTHNRVEGKSNYISLLYLPSRAPFDLWNREAPRGLKLYVQRVFIMDNAEQFLPLYLRFIKGIVDSSDLSLNISREILQQDPQADKLRAALTKRALDMLEKLASQEAEKYQKFWQSCGQAFKEGLIEDHDNREKIATLLRFYSTQDNGAVQQHGLDDYLNRMPQTQKSVYYLLAENLELARNNPHLEIFREKNIEVLLLTDRIDSWSVQYLNRYKDKELADISKSNIELEEDKAVKMIQEERAKTLQGLCERIQKYFGDRVQEVRVSKRLVNSAVCLAAKEDAMGAQMKKMLELSGQKVPETKPILEINAKHPLIRKLDNSKEEDFERLNEILFAHAQLTEGNALTDPQKYIEQISTYLV